MSPPKKKISYSPLSPADGANGDFDDAHLREGPTSATSGRFRDVVRATALIALAALVAYQASGLYRGRDGGRETTRSEPGVFTGGDCPNSPKTDPNPDMKGPKVVWKMSFPNSGTSYTGKIIKNLSNYTGATTYGKEGRIDKRGYSIPLRDDSPNGPYLSLFVGNGIPEYVLTKTHCGGRCCRCGPDKYIETQESFERACRTGAGIQPGKGKDGIGPRKVKASYSTDVVQRAVHVVRDPFDNVVSRFHLERKSYIAKNDTKWLSRYTTDFRGFQAYCRWLDDAYIDEEKQSRFIGDDILELFEGVPCHGEFLKYARWHNLAVATRERLRLPSHVLYYENYDTDFDGTVNALLGFLELERVGKPQPAFIKGKTYRTLYTKEQQAAAMQLIRRLSSPASWRLLERYAYV